MMVKIENRKLGQVIDLLFNLSLRGKESRHRTRLIKLLKVRLQEVEEQRIELAKEHANKDEKGEPIVKDGKFDIKDLDTFRKDYEELLDEEMVIEGGDSHEMLKTVKEVLLNCDREFSGVEAEIYDYLCEQFEKGGEEL